MLLQTNTEHKGSICSSEDLTLRRLGFALGTSRAPENEAGGPRQSGQRERSQRGRAVPTGDSRTRRRSRAGAGPRSGRAPPAPAPPAFPGGGGGPFPRAGHGALRAARRGPPRLPRPRGGPGSGPGPAAGPRAQRGGSGARRGPGCGPHRSPRPRPGPARPVPHSPACRPPWLRRDPGTGSGFRGGPGAAAMGAARSAGERRPRREREQNGTGLAGGRLHRPDLLRARPGLGPAGESCAGPRQQPSAPGVGAQPLPCCAPALGTTIALEHRAPRVTPFPNPS